MGAPAALLVEEIVELCHVEVEVPVAGGHAARLLHLHDGDLSVQLQFEEVGRCGVRLGGTGPVVHVQVGVLRCALNLAERREFRDREPPTVTAWAYHIIDLILAFDWAYRALADAASCR